MAFALAAISAALGSACTSAAGPAARPGIDAPAVGPAEALAGLHWAGFPAPSPGFRRPDAPLDQLVAAWGAHALEGSVRVRAARDRLAAVALDLGLALPPGPDPTHAESALAACDLQGVVGLGPGELGTLLACRPGRAAACELLVVMASERVAAARAAVRLSAALAAEERLTALRSEAREDEPRLDLLAHSGRVAPVEAAMAVESLLRLERRLAEGRVELAAARADLSERAGWRPDDPGLDEVSARLPLLAFAAGADGLPEGPLPAQLAPLLLECGVAEAALRHAAGGPAPGAAQASRVQVDLRAARVVGTLVPEPPSAGPTAARLRPLQARRDAAVAALEAGLLATLARQAAARSRLAEMRLMAETHLPDLDLATERRWRAAREAFAVDPGAARAWAEALDARAAAATDLIAGRAEAALAALDLLEAGGSTAAGAADSDPAQVSG